MNFVFFFFQNWLQKCKFGYCKIWMFKSSLFSGADFQTCWCWWFIISSYYHWMFVQWVFFQDVFKHRVFCFGNTIMIVLCTEALLFASLAKTKTASTQKWNLFWNCQWHFIPLHFTDSTQVHVVARTLCQMFFTTAKSERWQTCFVDLTKTWRDLRTNFSTTHGKPTQNQFKFLVWNIPFIMGVKFFEGGFYIL